MNFDLGPDERALQAAIRDVCRNRFPIDELRARGLTRDAWAALDDAGVFTLRLQEDHGGLGLGMAETVVVFEELGRALVPGPVVATHAGRTRGASEAMMGLIERDDPIIEHRDAVDVYGVLDDEGLWRVYPGEIDADPVADPLDPSTPMHRVRAMPKGEMIAPATVVEGLRTDARILTAAMLVGIAAETTDLAVRYAGAREQFGRPIGSFQAVKHLCADAYVRTEVARAALYAAACVYDDPATGDLARATAVAKALANDAALANAKTCVQVHGGMGFTWEVDVHLYLKRAAVLASSNGTTHAMDELVGASL